MIIRDRTESKGLVEVMCHGDRYVIREDDVTGDSCVISDDDPQVQGEWMRTTDDAVKYVLYRTGVLEERDYERARDRV